MANSLNWFEIPASNFARARAFYTALFDVKEMPINVMDNIEMAFFPADGMKGEVGGAVVMDKNLKPGADGPVVYLNAGPVDAALERAVNHGGTVVMPKMQVSPEIGDIAFFMDTEGNRVGLHHTPRV